MTHTENKTRQTHDEYNQNKNKKKFQPTRDFIKLAMQEYFARGGKITKIKIDEETKIPYFERNPADHFFAE